MNETLAKSQTKDFRILFFHRSVFTVGNSGESIDFINNIMPILEFYNVSMILHGHQHLYQRHDILTPKGLHIPEINVGTGGGFFDIVNEWKTSNIQGFKAIPQALQSAPTFSVFNIQENSLHFQT